MHYQTLNHRKIPYIQMYYLYQIRSCQEKQLLKNKINIGDEGAESHKFLEFQRD